MKLDHTNLKSSLRKRENELQKIIRQMKDDNLMNSTVFRNLQQELGSVKEKLVLPNEQNKF